MLAIFASAGSITLVSVKRTPDEVAQALLDVIDGRMTKLEWGGFITQPFDDPELEIIREKACQVDWPLNEQGQETLRGLSDEAKSLSTAEE
ncbi:hypothetical protein AUC45_02915 [Erythrobacter sp. YT30]|nr:hypothetical protein AUC45_02915 [Erythrobacter sp. YT30]